MSLTYLGVETPERWAALAACLMKTPAGLDTEYYTVEGAAVGPDPRDATTYERVRVHVWSVCFADEDDVYHTAVLPWQALLDQAIQAWLADPESPKYLHNGPVDFHAIQNHGRDVEPPLDLKVKGCVDTLQKVRTRLPGRAWGGGYALKDLARDYLQADNPITYAELMSRFRTEEVVKIKVVKDCSCGVAGCKKKKAAKPTKKVPNPVAHDKTEREVRTTSLKVFKKRVPIPLTSVNPGVPHTCPGGAGPTEYGEGLVCMACKWLDLVRYAGYDSLWALRLKREVLDKEGFDFGHAQPSPDPVPPRPRR